MVTVDWRIELTGKGKGYPPHDNDCIDMMFKDFITLLISKGHTVGTKELNKLME